MEKTNKESEALPMLPKIIQEKLRLTLLPTPEELRKNSDNFWKKKREEQEDRRKNRELP